MSRKIFIKKVIDKIKSKNYNARMELKEYREKIKQTQQQVADTLGISRQYVSDLERKSVMPSRKLAEKIVMWSEKQITFAELWNWQQLNDSLPLLSLSPFLGVGCLFYGVNTSTTELKAIYGSV